MTLEPFDVIIKDGWKKDENGRYGQAVVMKWDIPITEFAPTLEDLDRMSKLIDLVRLKDEANKKELSVKKLNEECKNIADFINKAKNNKGECEKKWIIKKNAKN